MPITKGTRVRTVKGRRWGMTKASEYRRIEFIPGRRRPVLGTIKQRKRG